MLYTFRNYKKKNSLGPFYNIDMREKNIYLLDLDIEFIDKDVFWGGGCFSKLCLHCVNKIVLTLHGS